MVQLTMYRTYHGNCLSPMAEACHLSKLAVGTVVSLEEIVTFESCTETAVRNNGSYADTTPGIGLTSYRCTEHKLQR